MAGVVGLKHRGAYGATKFALEGLWLSVANEVEPGLFRTDLLDARNVRYADDTIEDYATEGSTADMWSPCHGTQPGDPAKLGEVLVEIARMSNPPRLFVAGSDALSVITPAVVHNGSDPRETAYRRMLADNANAWQR